MKIQTSPTLRIVHPEQFSASTSQTLGSLRHAAISPQLGIDSKMWGGTFLVQPGARTGIHHHGEQETIVYVLESEATVRWADCGRLRARYAPEIFFTCLPG